MSPQFSAGLWDRPGPGGRGEPAPGAALGLGWLALAVAAVGAIALALRWHPPYAQVLYPDAAYYMRRALAFLTGAGSIAPPWTAVPAGGPVYPFLASILAPLTGDVETAGTLVSRLAGVALPMAVTWAGIRLGGVAAGLFAGLLAAVAPPLAHLSEVRLSDALFITLWLTALLWSGRLLRGRDARWEAPALGALLGVTVLTRAVGVTALPLIVAVLLIAGWVQVERRRALWRGAAWVLAGALAVVVPFQGYAWVHGWRTGMDYPLPQVLSVDPDDAGGAAAGPGASGGDALSADAGAVTVGQVAHSLARQGRLLARLLPVPVLALALLGLFARRARFRPGRMGVDAVIVGAGACYLLTLALFESSLTRYLVVLYPVAFLYAGIGLAALADGMAGLLRWERGSGPAAVLAGVLFLALIAGSGAALRTDAAHWAWDRFPPFDRATAQATRAAVTLPEPVYVYADDGNLAYYLNGYWAGTPFPPDGPAPAPAAAGSRVVVLSTDHMDRWPATWHTAFASGFGVDGFLPLAQRYWPTHHRLVTVYGQGATVRPAPAGPVIHLAPDTNLALARRTFADRPESRAALRGLGAIELLIGQYAPERIAVARAAYRRAEALPPSAPPPAAKPRAGRVWWARPPGEIYLAQHDVATHWNRAAAALATGDPQAAWSHAQALSGALGKDPRLAYLKGMVLMAMGRPGPAMPAMAVAGRALTDDPAVQVAWANALATVGRYPAAARVYRQVLESDPDNFGVWLNLYQVLVQDRQWDQADRIHHRMLALSPTSAEREQLDQLVRQVAQVRDLG